jgi:hypothetical protein
MREDSLLRVGIRMALRAALDEAKDKKCPRTTGCCIDEPGYVTIKFQPVQDKFTRHAIWRGANRCRAGRVYKMVKRVGLDPEVLFREEGFRYDCKSNLGQKQPLVPDISTAVLK